MIAKKIGVARALLLLVTSAGFAPLPHHRAYYGYAPGYGRGGVDLSIGSQR
jgi:hypothetical protein